MLVSHLVGKGNPMIMKNGTADKAILFAAHWLVAALV
jgi:hypothetical protein